MAYLLKFLAWLLLFTVMLGGGWYIGVIRGFTTLVTNMNTYVFGKLPAEYQGIMILLVFVIVLGILDRFTSK